MKKFIMAIVCLMTMVLSVNAQHADDLYGEAKSKPEQVNAVSANENGWVIGVTEEDELLDTTSEPYCLYLDGEKGGVYFYESQPKKLYLIAPDGHMFNTHYLFKDMKGDVIAVDVLFGLYDTNNKLLKRLPNCVFEEVGRETANRIRSRSGGGFGHTLRNIGKEIIEYIKKEKGYVRIVAPLYHENRNFDIKVPCMNN